MAWLYVFLAGLLEVAFAVCLKLSDSFSRWPYTVAFICLSGLSLWLLTLAMRAIPFGVCYAAWTGIGVLGTTLIGVVWFDDPLNWTRIAFTLTLLGSIVGLRLTA
ncbi:small multidrug resistance protein [Desulfarculus baarsii DSM 2075]|uniref:Guanidinium exporter n=1 Tax=Desulfarculus baarsii (strain ATCC 33931 / DSM 2075 / LMG 7858 / VKM B-1802 / 2st14) TaxID=644282 RepID=E1QM38_DESB2|nr:multidrug efflux SMR transporter [Desulfarculus baarsii]ADK86623.1 small multidrug resistance protein [Desulfarculus baarsii DSM 2075]